MNFQIKNKMELLSKGNRRDRDLILQCLKIAIEQVSPLELLENKLRFKNKVLTFVPTGEKFDLSKADGVVVVGAGKASGYLAQSIEKILGIENISAGYVNVLNGTKHLFRTKKIILNEASHPTPNRSGVAGAKRIVRLLESASKETLVICLISGGGSSLLPYPPPDISLSDKVKTTELLLKAGATIDEMNCVRKHISLVKGGQLVRQVKQSRVLSLIISDVVGDNLASIASGPTCPDPTTFDDAIDVIQKYNLTDKIPATVMSRIKAGIKGKIRDTPKPGDNIFSKVSNHIIASNKDACLGAVKRLNSQREIADCEYLGSYWRGEADDFARNLAAMFCQFQSRSGNSHRPRAFVWGGEATVTVRGKGKGGRNGEEALAALETIAACSSRYATVAFFATDGIDGKTDSAGAIIDPLTLDKARNLKVDPKSFLQNNDSYTFFRKVGSSLIITGPSGTNVNDIGIAILRARTD